MTIDTTNTSTNKFKATIEWMRDRYNKANQELFNGMLGDCIFKAEPITSHSYWLGMFSFGKKIKCTKYGRKICIEKMRFGNFGGFDSETVYVNRDNFFEFCAPTITMNTLYLGTEASLYCTLVHEMCHYYTYMNGKCPKQAHGVEFRHIGEIVSMRSKGSITVARLANAEQMEGYDVTPEEKAKREKRIENKTAKMIYIIVFKQNGEIRLIPTTSEGVINSVAMIEKRYNSTILLVRNQELKNEIFDNGYTRAFRTYRYYPVKKDSKLSTIIEKVISSPDNYDFIMRGDFNLKI